MFITSYLKISKILNLDSVRSQDGKLVARLPMIAHKTMNPDDEIVVSFNESEIICK